jgi:hypothetical protein
MIRDSISNRINLESLILTQIHSAKLGLVVLSQVRIYLIDSNLVEMWIQQPLRPRPYHIFLTDLFFSKPFSF